MSDAFLVVTAAGRSVGLPVGQLEAVTDPGNVAPVPTTEPALRGVATVRGMLLPVVSLAALLEPDAPNLEPTGAAVVVEAGGRRICLEVDAADIVVRGEPRALPSEDAVPWSRAVLEHEGDWIPLLDLDVLGARLSERGKA